MCANGRLIKTDFEGRNMIILEMEVNMNVYEMYMMYLPQPVKRFIIHGRYIRKCHKKAMIFKLWK